MPDLETYEADPGLYLDYRREMIGSQVQDTDGVIGAIVANDFDLRPYEAFIDRHFGASVGQASDRFVERFLGPRAVRQGRDGTLRPDVRHE